MPKHLTVQDKIIIHLAAYQRYAEEFECPEEVSQAGIATAIGKSRAHTTLELKALRDAELVSERVSHVRGAKSKRKVYNLTAGGIQLVQNFRGMLDGLDIKLEIDEEISELGGRDAVTEMITRSGLSELDAMIIVLGADDVIHPSQTRPIKSTDPTGNHEKLPELKYFFGREKELETIDTFIDGKGAVLSILGMPGIGKTTLARKILVNRSKDLKIFYIQLYAFDSPVSFIQQLARFLGDHGLKELSDYLANKMTPDIREIGWLLQDILPKEKIVLMVDDLDVVGEGLDGFLRMLHDIMGGGAKMIIMSSKPPGFYDRKDVNIDHTVMEMGLDGLDDESSRRLLEELSKVEEENITGIIKAVGGHPLALELADSETGSDSFQDYIYEHIISRDIDGFDFLCVSSVLRRPFNPWDMKIFGFSRAQTLSGNAYFTKYDGGLVMIHQAVASSILLKAGEKGIAQAHQRAGQYCKEHDHRASEILYHLIEAGLVDRARDHASNTRKELLSNSNLDSTLELFERLDDPDGDENLEMKDIMAEALNQKGDWHRSFEMSEIVLKGDVPELRLAALLRIAKIKNKLREHSEALKYIDRAVEECSSVDDDLALARVLLTRGTILYGTGDLQGALKTFDLAIELSDGVDDELFLQAMMERGTSHALAGELKKAMMEYERALKMAIEIQNQADITRIKLNMGLINMRMGKLEKAGEEFGSALDIARDISQPRMTGWGLIGQAELWNRRGMPDESLRSSEEALDIFQILGDMVSVSGVYSNIGASEALLGNEERAMERFEKSLELIKNLESPYILGQRYLEYGRGNMDLGKMDDAKTLIKKARKIFDDIGAKEDVKLAVELLDKIS
ncbi:MAG: tetratricopeptide repeat protein [Thermoplasmata archaeon]|nr:tetratricopeptide repeat protein [Thermoplasmata archaeon]